MAMAAIGFDGVGSALIEHGADSWRFALPLPICLAEGIGEFMIPNHTTAAAMAISVGIDPNAFRSALRTAKSPRKRNTDWEVKIGSRSYSGMRTVLVSLFGGSSK
jgi:UDP-N-acetylmuramyl pentapeptide synthase